MWWVSLTEAVVSAWFCWQGVDGGIVVGGARYDDENGIGSGAVEVYDCRVLPCVYWGKLTAEGDAHPAEDHFGHHVVCEY